MFEHWKIFGGMVYRVLILVVLILVGCQTTNAAVATEVAKSPELPTLAKTSDPEQLTDEEIHAMYKAATGRNVDIDMMTIRHHPRGLEGIVFAGDYL